MKNLRDYLEQSNYGHRYCPSSGTVAKDSFLVNDPQMIIAEEKLRDPDIYLFAKANPQSLHGSGLLTMGPATWGNLVFMVKKAFLNLKAAPIMAPTHSLQAEYTK